MTLPMHTMSAKLTICTPLVRTVIEDYAEQDEPVMDIPMYKEEIDKDTLLHENQAITNKNAEKCKEYWRDEVVFNERIDKYRSAFE